MRFNASRKRSAAPHCVDYFYLIAVEQDAVCVQALGYDLAIDFDRDLAIGEVGGGEQISDTAAFLDFARLAIEQDLVHALV